MSQGTRTADIGLTALTFLFGWQAWRSLLPLMAFLLRDRLGWSLAGLLGLSVGIFAVSFLEPGLARRLGSRRLGVLAAAGVGLARLGLQAWTWDPLGEFAFALAATACCLFLFLPARLATARDEGATGTWSFALGVFLGLALDTALHGLYDTWDVSWRGDAGSLLLVSALVAVQILALVRVSARPPNGLPRPVGRNAVWLAFGPFLFLQSLVFQNVARLTALTDWSPAAAFGWVLAGQVLGLGAVLLARRSVAAAAAVVVVASQAFAWPTGTPAALLLMAGQVGSALALTAVLLAIGADGGGSGRDRLALVHGVSMLAFLVLIFLYYSGYNISLPLDNRDLPISAAVVLALAAVAAARRVPRGAVPVDRRLLALALPLLLLPLLKGLAAKPLSVRAAGFPLRVMTYNVHCGFDPLGHLGMEALARTIAARDPDVVALQEVSRGWAINGAVDMLAWLGDRLGMPYVFDPTADPLWGNAVLSRLPIAGVTRRELPSDGLPIRRGLVSVRLDVGAGGPLELIATHFHHRRDEEASRVRRAQARALVEFWDGRPRTVVAGDLNAEPDHPEMDVLRRAGLTDAYEQAGAAPGYTFYALRPFKRIDYLWLSPDLTARDAAVAPDPTSDHLGVAATLVPDQER